MRASTGATPITVRGHDGGMVVRALERVRAADEAWLQLVLDAHPSVLPTVEADERIEGPLFSLGREVHTHAGPIDNLFISANGQLVVVETKLFRNPQARREVVAQIIDYAAHVRRWGYDRLDALSRARHEGESLWAVACSDQVEESTWIDRVSDNLEKGRMTLLVVGDGIRSETESLTEALAGHPDFQFRLALVEMRVFEMGSGERLVVPVTLTKTFEVERAVVTIKYEGAARPDVKVATPTAPEASRGRRVLSEQALLDALSEYEDGEAYARVARNLLECIAEPLQAVWTSAGFSIKIPDPNGSATMLSLFVVQAHSDSYGYLRWITEQLGRMGVSSRDAKALASDYEGILRAFGAKPTKGGEQYNLDLLDLTGKEGAFVGALGEFAKKAENAISKASR